MGDSVSEMDDFLLIIIIGLLCLIIPLYIFYDIKKPKNFPPGPSWLPFFGNSLLVKKLAKAHGGFHRALSYLAQKHDTQILGLKLGGELVVAIFSKDLMKEAFTREEFQGRPDNFFIRLRSMGSRKGITMTDGMFWQEQRSFAIRHLGSLGFGKSQMENLIIDEIQDLVEIMKQDMSCCNLGSHLPRCVLNVLWAFTAGQRFSSSDSRLTTLLDLMNRRSKAFDMAGGILSQIPMLSYIAPDWSGYNLICSINSILKTLIEDTIREHQKSLKAGSSRDFIDAFLHEMNNSTVNSTTFTEDQLIMVCLDFFIAGSQTTSNTLNFAFLNMMLHKQIQEQVYREIRQVLGDNKFPSLEVRSRLPYTEAVLLESQRMVHVVPTSGPRRVLWNTTLGDYNIPKNSTIFTQIQSIHHDEDLWDQPMTFMPERFLDEKNKQLGEELYLFGFGKRRCPGEALAKRFVFLIFCGVLRNFELNIPPGSNRPSIDPIPGITLCPKPYNILLRQRDD